MRSISMSELNIKFSVINRVLHVVGADGGGWHLYVCVCEGGVASVFH